MEELAVEVCGENGAYYRVRRRGIGSSWRRGAVALGETRWGCTGCIELRLEKLHGSRR